METAFSPLKSTDYAVGNFIIRRFQDIYMPSGRQFRAINEFLSRSPNTQLFFADVADPADFKRKLRRANRDQKRISEPVQDGDTSAIEVLFKQANLPALWFYREKGISTPDLGEITPRSGAERHALSDTHDLLISYDSAVLTYHLAFIAHDRDSLDWLMRIWLQRMRQAESGATRFTAKTQIGEMTDEITCSIIDKESVIFSELASADGDRLLAVETTFEVGTELIMHQAVPKEIEMRVEHADPDVIDPWNGEV